MTIAAFPIIKGKDKKKTNYIMTIIVRCILHKAVTPPCYILCLDHDEWRTFLFATPQERMRMVLTKLKRTHLLGATREMAWIPYEGQNKIIIKGEQEDHQNGHSLH